MAGVALKPVGIGKKRHKTGLKSKFDDNDDSWWRGKTIEVRGFNASFCEMMWVDQQNKLAKQRQASKNSAAGGKICRSLICPIKAIFQRGRRHLMVRKAIRKQNGFGLRRWSTTA
ncbi:hypothetical protein INT80_06765 [Gallibacterium anatis]|uniref:Uncharacterized protein n=1 Tax=Gallibacterium anatis TaxID=750 RepID=A0A930URE7_9PAST|nr:hypothetical protein [Gallibacterium anatis]